mmetsp:Transcript_26494/g.74816  ORF Transcript_26494/g.74816 Transcript_26494/m.74816 type:complete len:201 (-) Transcript_26494:209-811(-)
MIGRERSSSRFDLRLRRLFLHRFAHCLSDIPKERHAQMKGTAVSSRLRHRSEKHLQHDAELCPAEESAHRPFVIGVIVLAEESGDVAMQGRPPSGTRAHEVVPVPARLQEHEADLLPRDPHLVLRVDHLAKVHQLGPVVQCENLFEDVQVGVGQWTICRQRGRRPIVGRHRCRAALGRLFDRLLLPVHVLHGDPLHDQCG